MDASIIELHFSYVLLYSTLKEFQYQFLPVVQLWSKLLTLSPHLSKIHTFIPRKTYKMMIISYKTI